MRPQNLRPEGARGGDQNFATPRELVTPWAPIVIVREKVWWTDHDVRVATRMHVSEAARKKLSGLALVCLSLSLCLVVCV